VESLSALVTLPSLTVLLPAGLIALFLGFLAGRSGRARLARECTALNQRLAQKALAKPAAPSSEMKGTLANLARTLPLVVRDLNHDDLSPTDVPKQILRLANAIFEPEQILLYGIRRVGDSRLLTLSEKKGLASVPDSLKSIPVGVGKIGWAAEHELDMLAEDWKTLSRTERLDVPDNHADLRAEIIGPLVQHRKDRQHVLGVLCIGGLKTRPDDPKLMFQMVTNLGSLALVSAWNLKTQRQAAQHDGLTGLFNKRYFLQEGAPRMLVECENAAQPFSVFIFDIDHFKTYNDTNGHPAGDELLRTMGRMIKQSLRPGDMSCRYGGEEFVIAMPNTDADTAHRQAETLRKQIENEPFPHREKQPAGKVSISGGIAAFPKDGSSVVELVQRADEALYSSKKGGRNRINFYKGLVIGNGTADLAVVEALSEAQARADGPLRR
jgi:diguanylate cyclase (GGDEF)-like protein